MNRMGKPLFWHIFFPNHCPFCGRVLTHREECCDNCLGKLRNWSYKALIKGYPQELSGVQALYRYAEGVRYAISLLKFHHDRDAAKRLGQGLARMVKYRYREQQIDLVIPVPLSAKKRWRRGYNQSEWLATEVATYNRLPMQTDLLQKIRHTPDQHNLSGADRRTNLQGAFAVYHAAALEGKTILLVDDIYTTGYTASCCAKVLREAGAKAVYLAVVACVELESEE